MNIVTLGLKHPMYIVYFRYVTYVIYTHIPCHGPWHMERYLHLLICLCNTKKIHFQKSFAHPKFLKITSIQQKHETWKFWTGESFYCRTLQTDFIHCTITLEITVNVVLFQHNMHIKVSAFHYAKNLFFQYFAK